MGNPLETIAAVQEIEGQAAERRHLEMMAATIAAGQSLEQWVKGAFADRRCNELSTEDLYRYIADQSTSLARAIQEEVRR